MPPDSRKKEMDWEYAFWSSSLQVVVGSLTRDKHQILKVGFIHRYMFNSQDKLLGKGKSQGRLGFFKS